MPLELAWLVKQVQTHMNVDVLNESGADVDIVALTRLCRFTMRRMRLHPATELTVRLVDPDTIAVLNEQWMGKKGPTDVLSFPLDSVDDGSGDLPGPVLLGDVVVCPAVAETAAPTHAGHLDDELALLVVHGVLHVLGHDHARPDEAHEGLQQAFRLKLLYALGVPPALGACVHCGRAEHLVGFDAAGGGVVCASHQAGAPGIAAESLSFMVDALGAVQERPPRQGDPTEVFGNVGVRLEVAHRVEAELVNAEQIPAEHAQRVRDVA